MCRPSILKCSDFTCLFRCLRSLTPNFLGNYKHVGVESFGQNLDLADGPLLQEGVYFLLQNYNFPGGEMRVAGREVLEGNR